MPITEVCSWYSFSVDRFCSISVHEGKHVYHAVEKAKHLILSSEYQVDHEICLTLQITTVFVISAVWSEKVKGYSFTALVWESCQR